MKLKLTALSLGILVSSSIIFAATARDIRLTSIRQKGMGGVSVGIAKNDAALYQNPAGLMRVKNLYLKFPRVEVGVQKESFESIDKLKDLVDNEASDSEMIAKLQELTPLDLGFSVALNPLLAITVPAKLNGTAYAFGGYATTEILGELKRPASPYIELTGGVDVLPTIGAAHSFSVFDRKVSLGAAVKYIHREQIYDNKTGANSVQFSQTEIIQHINDTKEQELQTYSLTGVGVDLGLQAPFETTNSFGHWGIVVRNLGAELKGKQKIVDPNNDQISTKQDSTQTLPVTAALGFELERRLPLLGAITFAADYNVISPDSNMAKNTHFGIEKNLLFNRLSLRGGLNQGFFVGGVGLNLFLFHLDYAFYAEELGSEIGANTRLAHYIQIGILL